MADSRINLYVEEDGNAQFVLPSKLAPAQRIILWCFVSLFAVFALGTVILFFFFEISLVKGYDIMEAVIVIASTAIAVFLYDKDAKKLVYFWDGAFQIEKKVLWFRIVEVKFNVKTIRKIEYTNTAAIKEGLQYIEYAKYSDVGFYKQPRNRSGQEIIMTLSNGKKYVVCDYITDEEKSGLAHDLNIVLAEQLEKYGKEKAESPA